MDDQQKKIRIHKLWEELKALQASLPRSDWHAAFEAALRIDLYGTNATLQTEIVLGEEPPRADFIVLVDEEEQILYKKQGFFTIFRKFNILEYKRPDDSLNERVLRKAVAYANFYISLAEHEGDVPPDQVTVTVFRSAKNPKMFKRMMADGTLIKTAPGIYEIIGYTDLPFQIVVTSELTGEDYTAYRALTNKATEGDVQYLINAASREKEYSNVRHYGVLLRLISDKNPEIFEELKRRDPNMAPKWKEIFKDEIAEERTITERQTTLSNIKSVMTSFGVTAQRAMEGFSIKAEDRSWYEQQLGIAKSAK